MAVIPNDAHVWLARAAGNDMLAAYMYASQLAQGMGISLDCMLWHSAHCQLAMAIGGDLEFRDRKDFTKERLASVEMALERIAGDRKKGTQLELF